MEASGHDPVCKLWATEGELVSSRESLLAIGGMRAGTRLGQGVKTSRSTRREIRRGASDQRKRSRDAARTYHEPCCWSEPDYEGVKTSRN